VTGFVGLRRLLVLVGLVFAALPVGSALADTTIGATGSNYGTSFTCPASTDYAMPSYVALTHGIVTSFSMSTVSQNAGQQLDFQVLRPEGGTMYMVVGHTGIVPLAGTGATETFSANIDTQANDVLGVYDVTSVTNCIHDGGTDVGASLPSDPAVGTIVNFNIPGGPFSTNESANLAPDADLALTNVPGNMTVNATVPGGAVVNYTPPTVTDEDAVKPTVGCLSASGSLFAIGTTTVTCTVTDSDDSNSPVHASFMVTVNGALAQLQNPLLVDVRAMPASIGRLILVNDINGLIGDLQAGRTASVCSDLNFMTLVVQGWSGSPLMTTAQANTILADINQIIAVLGCNAT
jgi:hypothetical protein